MSSIEARMIHSCRLQTGTATATTAVADEYSPGAVAVTSTPIWETVKCLFGDGSGGTKRLPSGDLVQDLPTVKLPATITIVEGQTVEGLSAGFLRTYIVRKVHSVYTRILDHRRCDLEAMP